MNADFKIMLYSVLAYVFLDPICKLIIAAIKGIVMAIITICGNKDGNMNDREKTEKILSALKHYYTRSARLCVIP